MKRLLLVFVSLFLFSSISHGKTFALRCSFTFNNETIKTEIYDYIITKTSITAHKIQEFIKDYGFSSSSGTYLIRMTIRVPKKDYCKDVLNKLKWLRDNHWDKITTAEIWVHICRNDEWSRCDSKILAYQKNKDGSEYINWDIIDGL